MLPFHDENMKKAAEKLLEYSGTLSATFDLLRSDLLVTAVWYCLKEEQQKCKRLNDILSKQTSNSNTVITVPKLTASPKGVDKGLKDDKKLKSVSVAEKKTAPPTSTMPKTINNNLVTKGATDKVNSTKERRNSSDSDVCIIEIDDTDEVVEKTDNKKSKTKDETNNTQKETAKTALLPANKTVESNKRGNSTETQTVIASDTDDLFDMDCDEIDEEQEHINKTESETKHDKTVDTHVTTEQDQEITIISDDEATHQPKETAGESKSTKEEAKSKKIKKRSTRKDSKEKSTEEKGEVNVIMDDDVASGEVNSHTDTNQKSPHQCDKNEKSNSDKNKTPPFPTALTANVADKIVNEGPVESIALSYSSVLSQNETDMGLTDTQHTDSDTVSSFNQNLSSEVGQMNSLHQPGPSQSNIASNNTLPVNDPGTLNMGSSFVCPVANDMLNDQHQFLVQHQLVSATLADVKTEICSGPSQRVGQPPGYMFEDPRQVESYQDPLFASQPYVPVNTEPVSLSSLSSGALTYPYSSTTEIVPGLHGSRASGALSGYFDPRFQQQDGELISPNQDIRLKGRKRGSSVDTVSPPNKRRLLDFDRKWHEGPSSSRGQERYIAPPSNAMKMMQPSWNDSGARGSDTEWAMWFQSYKSISDINPPPFSGEDMSETIVQTETVGVSLDDIGVHDSLESDANSEEEKKSARGRRGRGRWLRRRGQRGRGLARGRGVSVARGRGSSVARGRGSSVSRGRSSSATRGRGRSHRGTSVTGARDRPVSTSEGSPQKSGTFSFYKRGRVGFSRTKTRSRGSRGFSGAASIAEAVKTSVRRPAAISSTDKTTPKRGSRGVRRSRFGRARGRGRGRGRRGQVQT